MFGGIPQAQPISGPGGNGFSVAVVLHADTKPGCSGGLAPCLPDNPAWENSSGDHCCRNARCWPHRKTWCAGKSGRGSIGIGSAGVKGERDWSMQRGMLSPRYTTQRDELRIVS
ncbi:DUF4113 domain-containing protein [Dyella kyungheensis]|uniref:DUF4113 domain-containing protein n=1 Tax=Dyella kyungheensis TaxID=1242174 RepID=UPI003CEA0CE9